MRGIAGQLSRTVTLLGLAVWTLLPLLVLVVVAFSGGWLYPSLMGASPGTPGWSVLGGGPERLLGAARTSVGLALATGALTAVLGYPLGRALSGLVGWARSLGAAVALMLVAAPPLALGVGLQYSLLSLGLGGTLGGVLLAHLVPAVGYATLFFLGVFAGYDRGIEEEARSLGASRLQTLVRVGLPLMRRPLGEAFALGFLVSWAQVPLTLLIGQGRVRTLTVEVMSWMDAGQDPLAAAGALALSVPPLLLLLVVALAARRTAAVLP
jgi:putative spermidine/putrescine transport system permease protein